MPPGGEGYYYFSTYLIINQAEFGYFDLQINGAVKCTAYTNQELSSRGLGACNIFTFATEGKSYYKKTEVQNLIHRT